MSGVCTAVAQVAQCEKWIGVMCARVCREALQPHLNTCRLIFRQCLRAASEGEPELGGYVGVIQVNPQQFFSLGDSITN